MSESEHTNSIEKKKKKKKHQNDKSNNEENGLDVHDSEKKTHKRKKQQDDKSAFDEGKKKKKRDKRNEKETVTEELEGYKKKKKKKSVDVVEVDTKERKKTEENQAEPYSGQWGEVSLGTDERKDKFLRLLGGYKSKNIEAKEKKKFSSLAFSQKKEEKFNDKLEEQYDTAFTITREKRGLGLGFNVAKETADQQPSFSWEK